MTKMIQRHDTAANWVSVNPILAQGEMGIEDDTRKFKFGDGTTAWADLPYASSEGGGSGIEYKFTNGIVNNGNVVGLNPNLFIESLNLETVGSPTLSGDFVGSNFSTSSYLTSPSIIDGTEDSWEIVVKFNLNELNLSNQGLIDSPLETGQNIRFTVTSENVLQFRLNSSLTSNTYAFSLVGTTTLTTNTDYYAKISYSNTNGYVLSLSLDGIRYNVEATNSSTTKVLYQSGLTWWYGRNTISAGPALSGSIYFRDSYVLRDDIEKIQFVDVNINYATTSNKPKINGVELSNNVSSSTINVSDKFIPDNPIYFNTVRTSNYNGLTYGDGTLTNPLTDLSNTGGSGYVGYGNTVAGRVTFDIDGDYFNSSLYLDIPISQGECLFLINPPMNSITNMGYPYILGNKNSDGYLKPIISFGASSGGYGQQIGDNCTLSIQDNKYLIVTGNKLSEVTTPALTYNSILKNSAVIEFTNSSIRNTYYGSSSNYMYTRNITIDAVPTINEINTLRIMVFKNNGVVDLTKIRKSPISALFSNASECVASYNSSTQVDFEPKDKLYMKLKTDGVTTKINGNGELEAIAPANMITSENIASDATIVGLNDAIKMAQGDITTLKETVLPTKTDKVQAAQASLPSSNSMDLTMGSTGTSYTAPANGWFSLDVWTSSTSVSYIGLYNNTTKLGWIAVPNQGSGYQQRLFIPARTGDNVILSYSNLDDNKQKIFKFIYAEGEV